MHNEKQWIVIWGPCRIVERLCVGNRLTGDGMVEVLLNRRGEGLGR